jgi:hypothetical protein
MTALEKAWNECTLTNANPPRTFFAAGFEAAQKPIPVTERLPEPDVPVLVYLENPKTWMRGHRCKIGESWWCDFYGNVSIVVTHWLPLPPDPE